MFSFVFEGLSLVTASQFVAWVSAFCLQGIVGVLGLVAITTTHMSETWCGSVGSLYLRFLVGVAILSCMLVFLASHFRLTLSK